MKHYHLYIAAGREIDDTTHFYKVGVSSGKQGDRDYLYLIAHAADSGHYFERWSADVDTFTEKLAASLQVPRLPLQVVAARDLVRAFKAAQGMPLNTDQLIAAHRQRFSLDTDYRISCNTQSKIKPSAKRRT